MCLWFFIPLGASSTGAIAGGVAAGAALVFAVPAIAFAMWRRRKPEEHFFDVPGQFIMVIHLFDLRIIVCSCYRCHMFCSYVISFLVSRGRSRSSSWSA